MVEDVEATKASWEIRQYLVKQEKKKENKESILLE